MKTALAPANAFLRAEASFISARASSQPSAAHFSAFSMSRTMARTRLPAASKVRASSPPTFPVIPVIAYMVVDLLVIVPIYKQARRLRRVRSGHMIGDAESTEGAMTFDGRVISNVGVLAAIVEGGNFARAAEALGLTRSGVSRAVSRLEARVGVRLLDRTTRAVALTDEGRRLYSEVAPLLTGIEDAVTVVSGSSVAVRGRLRVNVDAFFSRLLFAPQLPDFLALYPDLSLELVAKDQLGDLVGEGFDIAVRFGTPPDSSLVAKKLLDTRTITIASPAYLKAHGRPEIPADLVRHACIQVRDSLT